MHPSARTIFSMLIAMQSCLGIAVAAPHPPVTRGTNALEIQSMAINGKAIPLGGKLKINSGPTPQNIAFTFGQATNATRAPVRVRYKLDGFDSAWHEGGGEMFFLLRFYKQ